jgi:hypothetical protein
VKPPFNESFAFASHDDNTSGATFNSRGALPPPSPNIRTPSIPVNRAQLNNHEHLNGSGHMDLYSYAGSKIIHPTQHTFYNDIQ